MAQLFSRSSLRADFSAAAYRSLMLGRLQDRRGEPSLRTRGMAALLLLGVLLLAAPGLIALLHWAIHLFI
jgi:hypothetical protein